MESGDGALSFGSASTAVGIPGIHCNIIFWAKASDNSTLCLPQCSHVFCSTCSSKAVLLRYSAPLEGNLGDLCRLPRNCLTVVLHRASRPLMQNVLCLSIKFHQTGQIMRLLPGCGGCCKLLQAAASCCKLLQAAAGCCYCCCYYYYYYYYY